MPSPTHPRFSSTCWLVLAGLALLGPGTGCQSARPAFLFQPAAAAAVGRAEAPPAATNAPAPAPPKTAATTAAPAPRSARSLGQRQRRVEAARRLRPVAAAGATRVAPPQPTHRRPWRQRPQAPAEAGLGTTVLGVLGLVVLPIALIGLALSGGGLVWAIVAGAAAVAVLVAYLDPDKR